MNPFLPVRGDQKAPGSPGKEKAGGWGCPEDFVPLRHKGVTLAPPRDMGKTDPVEGGAGIRESRH